MTPDIVKVNNIYRLAAGRSTAERVIRIAYDLIRTGRKIVETPDDYEALLADIETTMIVNGGKYVA